MATIVTLRQRAIALDDDGTWRELSPVGPIVDRWRNLRVPADVVQALRGAFERLGVRIVDGGETLTCIHRGDRLEFAPGIDPATVDATVSIYAYQAERLAAQVDRGGLTPLDWFRVARELLVSGADAAMRTVQTPLSSNPLLRRLIAAKNLVHVFLVSPAPLEEPDAVFSLIHVNGRSLLVPGLHGVPERIFRLTAADALDLQRHLGAAARGGGWWTWVTMANWYRAWRRRVEVASPAG
jgi:hypothetical protein